MEKSNHAGILLACVAIGCLIVLIGNILSITVTHLFITAASLKKKISTTVQSGFYDNFQGNTYLLTEGQTSPNGKWKSIYSGYGWMGTVNDDSNSVSANRYFFEQPKTSTRYNETNAGLVTTTQAFSDFQMTLNMKTVMQLRLNSPPAPWETAWIFWHYTDRFHYYGLVLKTTGFQIEKKDNNNRCDCEIYLYDVPYPKVKLGQWQTVTIRVVNSASGKPHITVWVDGLLATDFVDDSVHQPNSSKLEAGVMGLYNEDSIVNFDNVSVIPLP